MQYVWVHQVQELLEEQLSHFTHLSNEVNSSTTVEDSAVYTINTIFLIKTPLTLPILIGILTLNHFKFILLKSICNHF